MSKSFPAKSPSRDNAAVGLAVPSNSAQPSAATAPDLRIEIQITESGTRTIFKASGADPIPCSGTLRRGSLDANYQEISEGLHQLKDIVQSETEFSDRDAEQLKLTQAFRRLHKSGYLLLTRMVGESSLSRLEDFLQKLRRTIPRFREPVIFQEGLPNEMMPIEIWPLWNFNRPGPIVASTRQALVRSVEAVADGFLGFSSVVVHDFSVRPLPRVGTLWVGPLAPVRKYQYAGLREVDAELGLFQPPHFRSASKPWPSKAVPAADSVEAFCRTFWDVDRTHCVHHFCCHFDGHQLNSRSFLRLSWDDQDRCNISLEDIEYQFGQFRRDPNLALAPGALKPLVFLNACGTSSINPSSISSLPLLILDKSFGYGGFIGTQINIPDATAKRFCELFYRQFVSGIPLGKALLNARCQLLYADMNPLGILYSAYADPALHIKDCVPWHQRSQKTKKPLHRKRATG